MIQNSLPCSALDPSRAAEAAGIRRLRYVFYDVGGKCSARGKKRLQQTVRQSLELSSKRCMDHPGLNYFAQDANFATATSGVALCYSASPVRRNALQQPLAWRRKQVYAVHADS